MERVEIRSQKGITLIALIVTIIVLLILATVSINLLVNQDIIKRAENAVDKYNTVQTNEIEQLNSLVEYMDSIGETQDEWWKLTQTERGEVLISKPEDNLTIILVAMSENWYVQIANTIVEDEEENINLDYITIENPTKGFYMCAVNDDTVRWMQKVHDRVNASTTINFEKTKWYYGTDGTELSDLIEYKGESPISKTDFSNGTIYSESYLDRVINSFNK